jgi:hypothetical protein
LALCKVLDFVELPKAQDFLLYQYHDFFEKFKPTEEFDGYQLKTLLRIAIKIDADMKWLHHTEEPFGIIVEPGWLYHKNAC